MSLEEEDNEVLHNTFLSYIRSNPTIDLKKTYTFGPLVGEGSYGLVFSTVEDDTVVLKAVPEREESNPRGEIAVMRMLRNSGREDSGREDSEGECPPYATCLLDFGVVSVDKMAWWILVIRKCEGSLANMPLPTDPKRIAWCIGQLFYTLLSVYYRLERIGISHTDLSFPNILYDTLNRPPYYAFYLSDFGVCVKYPPTYTTPLIEQERRFVDDERVPTIYVPVEMIREIKKRNPRYVMERVDAWSVGETILRMLREIIQGVDTEMFIYATRSYEDVLIPSLFDAMRIKRFFLLDRNGVQHHIPAKRMRAFLFGLLRYDPSVRTTIPETVEEMARMFEENTYIDTLLKD